MSLPAERELERCRIRLEEAEAQNDLLRDSLMDAHKRIVLIEEMAANLPDSTAADRIHDILHPEERTGP